MNLKSKLVLTGGDITKLRGIIPDKLLQYLNFELFDKKFLPLQQNQPTKSMTPTSPRTPNRKSPMLTNASYASPDILFLGGPALTSMRFTT